MYSIYRIYSPKTERVYIGMTSRSPMRRLWEHIRFRREYTAGRYRYCSVFEIIDVAGEEIFVEVLEHHTFKEDAIKAERHQIHQHGKLSCNYQGNPVVCRSGRARSMNIRRPITEKII